MKLQRIDHWPKGSSDGQSAEWVAVESCDGECYRAADVDALLARAVTMLDAMDGAWVEACRIDAGTPDIARYEAIRADLVALLSGEDA